MGVRPHRNERPAPANPFGLPEALVGFCAAFILGDLAVSIFGVLSHHPRHPGTFGSDVTSLIVLWACWVTAALAASARARTHGLALDTGAQGARPAPPGGQARRGRSTRAGGSAIVARPGRPAPPVRSAAAPTGGVLRRSLGRLRDDYGLALRPWPDVPLGIVVGVASQYLLVPLLELPLLPFVPHLYTRLGGPANRLEAGATGASLALLGLLVCVGSPLVEELFFRGLVLRGVAGKLAFLGRPAQAVLSVLSVSVLFGLAHFEALQLIGLIGFGAVLGTLAWRTGRLGPGIVAHAAFNTVTIVSLAFAH